MAVLEQVDIREAPSNLNREQVLQNIVDISQIPMPFMGMIGRDSHKNPFFEWACDRLPAPLTNNVVIDGAATGDPDSAPAVRLGNHSQISRKVVGASYRVESASNVGNESLARQVAKYTQALQRDMEAMLLLNNSNFADTGTGGAAGETAGLEAWLDDATIEASPAAKSPATVIDASGELTLATDIGGWTNKTGLIVKSIDYTDQTTPGNLTFADLTQVINGLYQLGADPTKLMARPNLIALLSKFMFTSSAQIATLVRDSNQMGSGTAQASVNQLISDFGIIVDFIPNRLMARSGDGSPASDTLFVFDPNYLSVSFMGGGIRADSLPVSGLSKATQIFADYGLCVKNPDALGGIICLSDTAAVTAT